MPLKAVLRVVNLFLALGAFLWVGGISLMAGEDLVWVVGKAIISFVVCWVILGWLVNLIYFAVHGGFPDFATEEKAADVKPKAAKGKAKK